MGQCVIKSSDLKKIEIQTKGHSIRFYNKRDFTA